MPQGCARPRGPVVPALAARRHVLRVDLPGGGKSPPPPSYDVPRQAGRLAALLDDLGLRSVTVAGRSSGGYAATALAERRPDLVGALALVSTGPGLDALLAQPVALRLLPAPPFGPLLRPRRTDAMPPRGDRLDGRRSGGRPGRDDRRRAGHPVRLLAIDDLAWPGSSPARPLHPRGPAGAAPRRMAAPGRAWNRGRTASTDAR
ncbi:alpha/beta fold hydrolase [Streptomyces violaceorubidus]|uniref:alpha/beta fold hydrolase n=1 Tax=Streptomyces violaceorubidus TaxID=284042 RepID=UPI001FD74A18|nr:alpha/beta hydrolase [Streptomyces violaceorubidus]